MDSQAIPQTGEDERKIISDLEWKEQSAKGDDEKMFSNHCPVG